MNYRDAVLCPNRIHSCNLWLPQSVFGDAVRDNGKRPWEIGCIYSLKNGGGLIFNIMCKGHSLFDNIS